MKQFYTLSFLLILAISGLAQPKAFNYQGVARNANGAAYANQNISVRLTIRSGSANGTAEYSETRNVTTNPFGLFNVQVGSAGASNVQGNFANIKWESGDKFLQTEISVNGEAFVNIGATQMMSVPYAIQSEQTKKLVLPFDTTVNMFPSLLHMKNETTLGAPVVHIETNKATGVFAFSEQGDAILGQTRGKSRTAVAGYSFADSTVGVAGTVHFDYKDGVGVLGEGHINNNGVRGISVNRAGVQGFSTNNYGVYGESSSFPAISGNSKTSTGVVGVSLSNVGVHGYVENQGDGGVLGTAGYYTGTNQYGVKGEVWGNNTGVIAKSNNTNGTALLVDGRMRITNNGGTISAGRVLTTDAQGYATWQPTSTIAFRAQSLLNNAAQAVTNGATKKVMFYQTPSYNIGNAYNGENSIFFPPVTGIYNLSASVYWQGSIPYSTISIKLLRNGTVTTIAESSSGSFSSSSVVTTPSVSTEFMLQLNDAVWIEMYQSNDANGSRSLRPGAQYCWFTGHLVTRL